GPRQGAGRSRRRYSVLARNRRPRATASAVKIELRAWAAVLGYGAAVVAVVLPLRWCLYTAHQAINEAASRVTVASRTLIASAGSCESKYDINRWGRRPFRRL